MMMSRLVAAGLAATAVFATAPAQATQIPDGQVVVGFFTVPTVNLATSPNTFSVNGFSFEAGATGGFASALNNLGMLSGNVSFSSTAGATLAETLTDFLVFQDGLGGTFNFSASSVKTLTYDLANHVFGLYLLGSTLDTNLGYDPTATSLVLSFSSVTGNLYSASATLTVPPAPEVPEPATWGMIVVGFGAMGAAMRRRQRTSLTFA
jgi:hypothetical protein